MKDLLELRSQIDRIDAELLRLLNERAKLVVEVGKIKIDHNLPIYVPEREHELIHRLLELNPGPLSENSMKAIYGEIISASRAMEKNFAVCCLGPAEDPSSYQAALLQFGFSTRYVFANSISEVLHLVENGESDCGVIPAQGPPPHAHSLSYKSKLDPKKLGICSTIQLPPNIAHKLPLASEFLVISRTSRSPFSPSHDAPSYSDM